MSLFYLPVFNTFWVSICEYSSSDLKASMYNADEFLCKRKPVVYNSLVFCIFFTFPNSCFTAKMYNSSEI